MNVLIIAVLIAAALICLIVWAYNWQDSHRDEREKEFEEVRRLQHQVSVQNARRASLKEKRDRLEVERLEYLQKTRSSTGQSRGEIITNPLNDFDDIDDIDFKSSTDSHHDSWGGDNSDSSDGGDGD